MDEMVKIPDSDYAKLEENARKVLETLSPEAVSELRRACIDQTRWMLERLNDSAADWKRLLESLQRMTYDPQKDNPFRKAKKKFWLIQLVNFIATFVFRVPREFTPTAGLPFGSSKLAREFDESARNTETEMRIQFEAGQRMTRQTIDCFRILSDNVKTDDAKVIAFCASCADIKRNAVQPQDYVQSLHPSFKKLAALAYLNNAPFSAAVYSTKYTIKSIEDNTSKIIDTVSELYQRAIR